MSDLVGNPEDRFSRVTAHIALTTFFRNHFIVYVCIVFFKPCQCQGVTALKVIYYISFMKSHKQFLSQVIAREMVFQMLLFSNSLQ